MSEVDSPADDSSPHNDDAASAGGAITPPPPVAWASSRFSLLEELGTGSSGTVYRARILSPLNGLAAGTEVAIKFLRQDLAADASAQQRLRAEGQLGLRIRAANVVRIFAVESMPLFGLELTYIVMELVRGRSLRAFLDERGVPGDLGGGGTTTFARRVGADAALGLSAIHREGVVHRDVKPENLLLTPDDVVKVMDLGLARVRAGARRHSRALEAPEGSSSSGGFFGNVAYAAPERFSGSPLTPSSDLYALGVILYELVTGSHPFADATTADEMIRAHREREPAPLIVRQPRISPFIDTVVRDLLMKDPTRRIESADALATILRDGEDSRYWKARERTIPVLAARSRLHRMRRLATTPLVGRRAEAERLDRQLARVQRGRGRIVVVEGTAGVGRRRLCDEVAAQWIERTPIVYLAGIAEESATTTRGKPLPGILVDWLLDGGDASVGGHDTLRERLRARAEERMEGWTSEAIDRLLAAISTEPTAPGLDGEERAEALASGLRAVAAHAGRTGRTVVVRIDQAEELGTVGLATLRLVAETVRSLPLLVVLVADEHAPSPVRENLARIANRRTLRVDGLDADSWRTLGRSLFRAGDEPSPGWLDDARTSLSANPGALLEALEDWRALGRLRGELGDLHGLDASASNLPPARPSLARLRGRVRTLTDADRHVVLAAAVLGRRCALDDVVALTGRPELSVLEVLARFRDRFVTVVRGNVVFRHPKLRRAVLDAVPVGVTRTLARAAAWLREDRGANRLEVGLLLSRAHEHASCLDPLLDGLQDLLAQGALRTAKRVLQRVRIHLNRLPRTPDWLRRRVRYLLLLAAAMRDGLEMEGRSAWRELRRANLIASHLGDARTRTRVTLALGTHAQESGQFLAAQQLLMHARNRAVLGHLDTDPDPEARQLVGDVFAVLGRVMAWQGLAEEAFRMTHEALGYLLPESREGLQARVDLAVWESLRMHTTRALQSFAATAEDAHTAGEFRILARIELHQGRLMTTRGRFASARHQLEDSAARGAHLGDRRVHARSLLALAENELFSAPRPPIAALERAVTAAERVGDRVALCSANAWQMAFTDGQANDPTDEISELGAPAIAAIRLIAIALRDGDPDSIRRDAIDLLESADIPLLLHLTLLKLVGREGRFRNLIAELAMRIPAGSERRTFTSFATRLQIGGMRL